MSYFYLTTHIHSYSRSLTIPHTLTSSFSPSYIIFLHPSHPTPSPHQPLFPISPSHVPPSSPSPISPPPPYYPPPPFHIPTVYLLPTPNTIIPLALFDLSIR